MPRHKGLVINFIYQLVAIVGGLFDPFTLKLAAAGLLAVILVRGGAGAVCAVRPRSQRCWRWGCTQSSTTSPAHHASGA